MEKAQKYQPLGGAVVEVTAMVFHHGFFPMVIKTPHKLGYNHI